MVGRTTAHAAIDGDRPLDVNQLLFCNQFILGAAPTSGFDGWQRVSLGEGFTVSAHPLLNVVQERAGPRAATLLGFMLDPRQPEDDDRHILRRLLAGDPSRQEMLARTSRLGGRWVLIIQDREAMWLCQDALGLRQVFCTNPTELGGGVWAMSQPGIALDLKLPGATVSRDGLEYMQSGIFRDSRERRWPGASAPISGLRHLLPNHYLDLRSGETVRYWPDRHLQPLSVAEAIERVALLLRGMIDAASRRFELALSLTAGIDSRLVLAACRPVQSRITCITLHGAGMPADSADVRVPSELLARLGLPHHIVRGGADMSRSFAAVFARNVVCPHAQYGADAEALLTNLGRRYVAMTGSGCEVGRGGSRLWNRFYERHRSARFLSMLEFGGLHPYLLRHLAAWRESLGETYNIHPLDIFEWEQGHGNWLAMTQLEFDMAWREIFTPYNCRELLVTMLAVPDKHRQSPRCDLVKKTIRRLWPDVLSAPINPHKRQTLWSRHAAALRFTARYALKSLQYRQTAYAMGALLISPDIGGWLACVA